MVGSGRLLIRTETWNPEHKWKERIRDISSIVTRKKKER